MGSVAQIVAIVAATAAVGATFFFLLKWFFAGVRRKYQNANASVRLSLSFVQDIDDHSRHGEPVFTHQLNGLELHNHSRDFKRDLLKVLSRLPRRVRSKIELPDAYWKSASRVIVNAYAARLESNGGSADGAPGAENVLDAACAIVETALKPNRFTDPDFKDGDVLHVYIDRQTDVWLQRVNIQADVDGSGYALVHVGNINERTASSVPGSLPNWLNWLRS